MRWFFYNLLFTLAYPVMMPKFVYRMWRRGGYRHAFGQRLGRYDAHTRTRLRERSRIWIHGVSVGEIAVAAQFMRAWRQREPDAAFVLSTTTSTGYRQAGKALNPEDILLYFPLDYPRIVRRVLATVRPRALILVESELWPNMTRICHSRNIPLFMINGRVSDKSYPGYRALRSFFGPVLRCFDRLLAQSARDAERLVAMGASKAAIAITGTFKYDAAVRHPSGEIKASEELAALCGETQGLVLMGGSTWPGEEELLLKAYRELRRGDPSLRLILAPRHAERADQVANTIRRFGFHPLRLSSLRKGGPEGAPSDGRAVLLIDTTGDMMNFYARADIVFVGKTITAVGGQNMIEPALCGKAVVVGPHTENFRPVMRDLLADGAICQISGSDGLCETLACLVRDKERRAVLGRKAARAVESRRGAVAKSVELIGGRLADPPEARSRT